MLVRRGGLLCVLLVLLVLAPLFGVADAGYPVSLKPGDYMVYKAIFTGGNAFRHYSGARITVVEVEDQYIVVQMTTYYSNGTAQVQQATLDPVSGSTAGDMVVLINLNVGQSLYDEYQGNITISRLEPMSFCDADRTVMVGFKGNTTYYWDRSSGVLDEAIWNYSRFSIDTLLVSTNVWVPDILGLTPTLFYIMISAIAADLCVLAVVLAVRRFRERRSRSSVGKGAYWQREFEDA